MVVAKLARSTGTKLKVVAYWLATTPLHSTYLHLTYIHLTYIHPTYLLCVVFIKVRI